MVRTQDGDRDAFRALLEKITPILKAFLRKRIPDSTEVDDVCQEILLALYEARHTYQPQRPLEPWLFAIARNISLDYLRRRWERVQRQELVESPPQRAVEMSGELSRRLQEGLKRMPPAHREAFTMLKIDGISVAEAARKAGVSAGTLRVRAHRAYQALKALFVDRE